MQLTATSKRNRTMEKFWKFELLSQFHLRGLQNKMSALVQHINIYIPCGKNNQKSTTAELQQT